jgi:ribosomal protein S18 acetylase RimI-like enzyme
MTEPPQRRPRRDAPAARIDERRLGPLGYARSMARSVRGARAGDADAIARAHAESWRLTYAGLVSSRYLAGLDERALSRHWTERLRSDDRDESVLVGLDGGEVVGFSVARPCAEDPDLVGFAGEVQMLYVRPGAQRRGVGAALVGAAREELAESRLYWLVVWVVEANHAARAFYRRVGLGPDGARRDQRLAGEPVTVVRYAAPLNPVVDFSSLFRRR